jgi:hypothetical protein
LTHNLARSSRAAIAAAHFLIYAPTAAAQHQHADTATSPAGMAMPMNGALGISMDRTGSGTTWIPDAVLLPSRHFMAGSWMLMVHGFLFGQYTWTDGPRGASQWGSLNWAMLMADRPFAGGRLQLRFMPSLDPWTVGRCGYPVLLQSGETCQGAPLVDRQHPHDFFMEVAAVYEREITRDAAMFVYAAPAGEPALGPVAFMHRPSAMDEPQAPLSHHWQDATHISFGVLTAGIFSRTARLELSAFNAHEPNEQRWDFDRITVNSFSGRVTLNPTANLSLTAGFGALDNPERQQPAEDMTRFVASAMYGRAIGARGQWASTVILGSNKHPEHRPSHALLAEAEAVLDERHTLFGRFEHVRKNAHELQLAAFPDEQTFDIAAASVGYIRDVARGRGVTLGLGARGSVSFVPPDLESAYGSRTPLGGMIFLRVRPRFLLRGSDAPGP